MAMTREQFEVEYNKVKDVAERKFNNDVSPYVTIINTMKSDLSNDAKRFIIENVSKGTFGTWMLEACMDIAFEDEVLKSE